MNLTRETHTLCGVTRDFYCCKKKQHHFIRMLNLPHDISSHHRIHYHEERSLLAPNWKLIVIKTYTCEIYENPIVIEISTSEIYLRFCKKKCPTVLTIENSSSLLKTPYKQFSIWRIVPLPPSLPSAALVPLTKY